MISPQQAAKVMATAEELYSCSEVERALDNMAEEITGRLSDADPVVLCVMNGALIPMGQLLTRLNFPLRQDYIHASRYRGKTTGADLQWIRQPATSLQGETVLVVDDILDEGITLVEIVKACQEAGADSVLSAVLVEKLRQRENRFIADFVGLRVEDVYVFGFGMDYKGYLRNMAGIYAVKQTE